MPNSLLEALQQANNTSKPVLDPIIEHNEEQSSELEPMVLTENNPSNLPDEARRAIVYLLKNSVVLNSQKANIFSTLCRYQTEIRHHLAQMYLILILDERMGVAFVQTSNQESEDDETENEEIASLITRRTLTLHDTLLLLVLRKHYQERENTGEQKIMIDLERIETVLSPFMPLTDHASLDRKRLLGRITEMIKRKLLTQVRGSENRYEITPLIRYVVNADFLQSLLDEYLMLAEQAGVAGYQGKAKAKKQGEDENAE